VKKARESERESERDELRTGHDCARHRKKREVKKTLKSLRTLNIPGTTEGALSTSRSLCAASGIVLIDPRRGKRELSEEK